MGILKHVRTFLLWLILLVCVNLASCDYIGTSNSAGTNQDLFIEFDIQRPSSHGQWKDKMNIYSNGWIDYQRLEGEEAIPSSSRMLSDAGFKHIKNLVSDFYSLQNKCIQYDEGGVELYEITFHGPNGERTVHCNMSSLSGVPENEELSPIVHLLRDFRMSMIGEERFSDQLKFTLQPDKTAVDLDEEISLRYEVTNQTDRQVTIGFSSSAQLGFEIYKEGKIMFSSGAFGAFGILTTWEISPYSTEVKEYHWDHSSYDGSIYHDRKLDSGTYTIIQYLQNGNSPYRATKVTITEQGDGALQPRVLYNRFDDPSLFVYELNNRISEPFSFDFSTDRKVGFVIREYDPQSKTEGEIIYRDTSIESPDSQITIRPFENFVWKESWNRKDNDGILVPSGFYWAEMWLMDQQNEHRAGRRIFIDN